MTKKGFKQEDSKENKVADPILSKYKAPTVKADAVILNEEQERKKRVLKEKQRVKGRIIPKRGEEEHERSLVLIATKGVVQLFNTVSEFQTNESKQARQELKDKNQKYSDIIQKTGEGQYANRSNKSIIEKL